MKTIRKTEYIFLCYFIMSSMFWGITSYVLLQTSYRDSWLSIIISLVLGIIPLILFYLTLNLSPCDNIVSLINKHFGKFGIVINIILMLVVIIMATLLLWNLITFISYQYLFKTPNAAIAILFMSVIAYIVSKDLSVISRCGGIMFFMVIILFLITFFTLLGKINLSEIKPLLENGFKPVLKGSYLYISNNIFPLYLLLIIPKNNIVDNSNLKKSLFIISLMTIIMAFIVIFCCITIFGAKMAALYQFLEYHILKTINIADFFQRIESILSIQLIFSLIMGSVLYLYYLKTSFKQIFKINKKDNLIIILFSIIITILSLKVFRNSISFELFILNIYPFISIILFIIPLIIFIKAKVHPKL